MSLPDADRCAGARRDRPRCVDGSRRPGPLPPARRPCAAGGVSLPDHAEENAMKPGSVGAGLAAWAGAALSSLCCLLPLAVIVLGLGSGAFMAVTMQYRWILIPAGVLGVTTGFVLYVRERRRGEQLACPMAGRRVTLAPPLGPSFPVPTSLPPGPV